MTITKPSVVVVQTALMNVQWTYKGEMMKGNIITRARSSCNLSVGPAHTPPFLDDSTKFYKRAPSFETRAMWKKYPTPFVHKNPVPEGDAVLVRHYHPSGTYEKHLKSLETS